ncbi:pirin family protein [Nonomuraea sp. NPDC050153]|uniref:pirin family protein n=1 Tax=Nonomuraea sp. NPDC050153 TaxID=3364359 RepID=UPI0037B8E509
MAEEVLHRDSLGTPEEIRPGQLNLMTAGRGISHYEESPHTPARGAALGGLSDGHRQTGPGFEHQASLPVLSGPGFEAAVIMSHWAGWSRPPPRTARWRRPRSRWTAPARRRSIRASSTGC